MRTTIDVDEHLLRTFKARAAQRSGDPLRRQRPGERRRAHAGAPRRRHGTDPAGDQRPGVVRARTIFEDLCVEVAAQGPSISDVYHAALAVEHGCERVSFDRDFARFGGLRWRSPLD